MLAGLTVSMAWSQEDVYLLNTQELGEHTRPLVLFEHQKHVEKMNEACISCHHDYNENLGMSDSEGARLRGLPYPGGVRGKPHQLGRRLSHPLQKTAMSPCSTRATRPSPLCAASATSAA